MKSSFYVDFVVSHQPDLDLAPRVLRNQVYGVLHGAFRQQPQTFAIALSEQHPHILRVFAATEAALLWLVQAVSAHWRVRDYCTIRPIHAVGEHHGAWVSYKRFRVPSAKSDRNATDPSQSLAARRLAQAIDNKKPYLQVKSSSTQQRFTIFIDCVVAEHAGDGLPDGYGLARSQHPFAVPELSYDNE